MGVAQEMAPNWRGCCVGTTEHLCHAAGFVTESGVLVRIARDLVLECTPLVRGKCGASRLQQHVPFVLISMLSDT